MQKYQENIVDFCNAIYHGNLQYIKDHSEEFSRLRTIQVSYIIKTKKSLIENLQIDLKGKSFFHLVAFSGRLEMLYEIHPRLIIPIIPVDIKTLRSNNPYQYLWSNGKYNFLIYCMSMCSELGYKKVLNTLNINVLNSFGHASDKEIENTINEDIYKKQLNWLENKNWEMICDAIEQNQWMISIFHLLKYEHLGLFSHINNHCTETLKSKYLQLKKHALHEKNTQESIKSAPNRNTTSAKKSRWPSTTQISYGVLTTLGLFFVARNFFCFDDASNDLTNNRHE